MKPNTSSASVWATGHSAISVWLKVWPVSHTRDPAKNKDCHPNSKYQRLKSLALSQGTPQSLNVYCVSYRSVSGQISCGNKTISKTPSICIFCSVPLCPIVYLLKIHSFKKKKKLSEKQALSTICSILELKVTWYLILARGEGSVLQSLRFL